MGDYSTRQVLRSGRADGPAAVHEQRQKIEDDARQHKHADVQAVVDRLEGVSLGAGTTPDNDPFEHKQEAAKTAYGSAVVSALGQPSTNAGTDLLRAYAQWRQRHDGTAVKASTDDDVERLALKKSRKRLRKHLTGGMSTTAATVGAYAHYKKHGGRATMRTWAKRIAP